jgi:DNA-binding CsgD family transcriptional regulator
MDSTAAPAGRAIDRTGSPYSGPVPLLVGRAREQAALREELAGAVGGHGRLVLLGGEAGIGKTTLARDLTGEAVARGARLLTGACYDLTNTPPYGPWLDLFAASQRDPDLPASPAAFAGGVLARVPDQAALFADVRRYVAELSADRPAVLLLEDLHWADPASVELLRHVVPHLRHGPVLLLVTYRADELSRRHPLAQQLPALVREAEGLRLDLRRLDGDALHALVASRYRLTTADEARLVAYLEQHAEGNPFFATELFRALEEDALLRQSDDHWRLGELDHVLVPSFLRQVIEGRVARLGQEVREPLAMAAVIGQDVSLALWAEVADLDDETLLGIVEQAVDAHLLAAERDGVHVRFVHALTREALYEGILPPRRRLRHRQVAETLMAGASPDPDVIAFHLQQAGDPLAWEWLVKAGDRAQRAYAWLTAAERFRAAATLLAGTVGEDRMRCQLLYRLSRLQRFSDPAGAIGALDEAGRLAARVGDPVLAAEIQWHRGNLLYYADRCRAGLAASEMAVEALEALPLGVTRVFTTAEPWLADAMPEALVDTADEVLAVEHLHAAMLHFRRATQPWTHACAGHPQAAIPLGERYLAALAETPGATGGIRSTTAFPYLGIGVASAVLGRPEDACQAFARARALFVEQSHHALTAFTLLGELREVALTYDAADPARRRLLAAEAEAALARAGGALGPGVSPALAWLNCLVLDGQWDEADRVLEDLPLPGNSHLRREVTDSRATLARHRGQQEVAWAQIRPLFPQGPVTEPGDLIHQEGLFLQCLAADLCLDTGDGPGARDWLEAHDRWLAWSESVLGRAEGQLAWARYHWAAGDAVRARLAADDALTLAALPDQPLIWLAVHRLLGEIETAAGEHAAAEGQLAAALDLAGACEAPFERALTLLAMADLHVALGKVDEATTCINEVRQTCAALSAAPTLARVEARAARLTARPADEPYPAGLTQREVEVLRLLPRGLSNAEIGAMLFLSPRTVQTHLTNLYGKLGVNGRAEAVAYAMAHGLA